MIPSVEISVLENSVSLSDPTSSFSEASCFVREVAVVAAEPTETRTASSSRHNGRTKSGKGKKGKKRAAKRSAPVSSYDDEITHEFDGEPFYDEELMTLEEFEELNTFIASPGDSSDGRSEELLPEGADEDEFFQSIPTKKPSEVAKQPRQKTKRRRQIDPTTCERDYTPEEVEFMRALDEYKRNSGRMFPTCSEILEVVLKLGYSKNPTPPEPTPDVLPELTAGSNPEASPAYAPPFAQIEPAKTPYEIRHILKDTDFLQNVERTNPSATDIADERPGEFGQTERPPETEFRPRSPELKFKDTFPEGDVVPDEGNYTSLDFQPLPDGEFEGTPILPVDDSYLFQETGNDPGFGSPFLV